MNVMVWKTTVCFRCGLEDHFIANFSKPDSLDKKVYWNMKILKIVCSDQQKWIRRRKKYRSKRVTEDIRGYGTYVFQCVNP